MNITEMHVWFRQYAQQMGMQNVRAILPEQIDLLINTSITDTINQLIKENIGITNDRVITDNSKIGQINAFQTLYKVALIEMCPTVYTDLAFVFKASDRLTGKMSNSEGEKSMPDFLYLVDFSLNYKKVTDNSGYSSYSKTVQEQQGEEPQVTTTYVKPSFTNDALETNFFPVRIIDDAFLADTLNDFVLKNRLRSPILVTYNNGVKNIFDIYIDKFKKVGTTDKYVLENNLVPYKLRMSYIAKPAVVKYAEDIDGQNVDCDLPEYMHVDILKHAVDLYRVAITGSLHASQMAEQNQNQENLRNNYRNEGYNQNPYAQQQQ